MNTDPANPAAFLATVPDPGPTGTEARVCEDIARRQRLGIAKYGTTVEGNPLPMAKWLRHAYEEALDFAVYLRRIIEEKEKERGLRDALDCAMSSIAELRETVAARDATIASRDEDIMYAHGRVRELEHDIETLRMKLAAYGEGGAE